MTITDSEVIIGVFSTIANILQSVGDFLSTGPGMVSTIMLLSTIGLTILGNKMRELKINKQIQKIQQLQNIQAAKNRVAEQKIVAEKATQLRLELERTKAVAEATLASKDATADEKAKAQAIVDKIDEEIAQAKQQEATAKATLTIYEEQAKVAESQVGLISQISSGISGLTAPLFMIITL